MKKLFLLTLLSISITLTIGIFDSVAQSIYRKNNLVAWCIVPFDNTHRTPAQRIEMLKQLGIHQYAYDWRTEHLATAQEEWKLAKKNGIKVQAVWFWIDGNTDKVDQLGEANEKFLKMISDSKLKTQIWVGVNGNFFTNLNDEEKLAKGVAMVKYLDKRAQAIGCKIALYNHGDWFGEPENEIKIIQTSGLKTVGIIYNYHHAHEQLDRYEQIITAALPYLWAVNINGMKAEGPKILPLGQGNKELEMMSFLKKSGYKGPIGILGHVEDADVEKILKGNLAGLKSLTEKMKDTDASKTL